jgi:hypothetical protein
MEGATTETGPMWLFDVKEACTTTGLNPTTGKTASETCDYSGQFSQNSYSWNNHANVIYLDQPRNVGYSFGYSTTPVKNSQEAADDFVIFINNWLKLFPEFVGRKLIIAGMSKQLRCYKITGG